ncbi:RNA-binding protein 42 [Dermatophagoides pteronyssinus]|uniref:RNA-binding protein 42 n=2 Tax=Dermatophagoides pteronyssinus TaxID=6956 RepID=A0A6P6Y3N6_DERPT|nr:RNA-binding protein 42-like [Dermatophagoides pteronyssinus]KAH9423132.1 RNA-binding protein 42 [Dermatophagoides pteronyssinus]
MNYQHQGSQYHPPPNQSNQIDMDAEMSRFEKEVLSVSANASSSSSTTSSNFPVHFIPHQIQRQLPLQRTQQATFVPAGQYAGSSMNSTTIQSSNQGNAMGQSAVNYTVTPMQVPSNVQQISTTPTGQLILTKTKSKSEKKGSKKKKNLRIAGGQVWEDPTLEEWDPNDFRLFCGDLGNDVSDDVLTRAFNRYPSFIKAKVVRDKRTNKSRGFGFVSFKNPVDFARAIKEMNGRYVGSRPIKLRKSNWQDRNVEVVKRKMKQKQKLGLV